MTDAEDIQPVEKAVSIKVTPGLIASALDSQSIRTSFGRLPLADEKSNPVFSFSKSHRASSKKLYMGEDLITSEAVVSPGPKYLVRDNISMRTLPQFSFGKGDRVLNGSQRKFDYFDRKDVLSDVTTAHQSIQRTIPNVKFGTSSRFSGEFASSSPGPIYDPKLTGTAKGNGKFVLGGRHSGVQGDPLMLFTGTSEWVWTAAWLLLPIGILAALGQWCMTRAYNDGATMVVANLQYSGIVFSALFGLFLFGDQIPWIGWGGIVIIVLSGIAATALSGRNKASTPS